jgi:hypothetical protein
MSKNTMQLEKKKKRPNKDSLLMFIYSLIHSLTCSSFPSHPPIGSREEWRCMVGVSLTRIAAKSCGDRSAFLSLDERIRCCRSSI